MVKKLFKHEFLAVFRLWLPMQIILLAVALFGRILQFFESDTTAYNILFGSAIVMYVLAIFAALMLTLIFGIVRFYKNLFSHEGYLSFTLPVTPTQHIMVKTLVASASMIGTLLVAVLSLVVFTFGEVFSEGMKAAGYLIKRFAEVYGSGNTAAYIIEGILLIAAYILAMYLLYYFCIALGQTFKKNRIVGAVGVYFIYYTITQVFSTIITILFVFLTESKLFRIIADFLDAHPEETIHIALCGMLVFMIGLSAIYFFVVKAVIHKKLNLE